MSTRRVNQIFRARRVLGFIIHGDYAKSFGFSFVIHKYKSNKWLEIMLFNLRFYIERAR